jgi:hypothetical protein
MLDRFRNVTSFPIHVSQHKVAPSRNLDNCLIDVLGGQKLRLSVVTCPLENIG